MKTIYVNTKSKILIEYPLCAAIGNFDGVHLGHKLLIEQSKKHKYKSAVVTFYPHPSTVLKNIPNYPLLTPIEHKKLIIDNLNVDYLIVIEFDYKLSRMSVEDFMSFLISLNIKSIVCGYDFSFGYMGMGSIRDLERNFEVFEIQKYIIDGIRVSSTYIRELLESGDVKRASKLLGRNYSIKGKVIHGNELGRTIGFPTANIEYLNYFLPKNGVYFVNILIKGKSYYGMCNIGNNPTFNYSENKRLEVNIFDFDEIIYSEVVEVYFIERIRGEKKLNSKEELKSQLAMDEKLCKEMAK